MMRVAAALALCSEVVLGARYRRNVAPCDELANIEVKGKKFGTVAEMVCKAWPNVGKGEFPVESALNMEEWINIGLQPGGVWELLEQAKVANEGNFCRRTMNNKMYYEKTCPKGYTFATLGGFFENVCISACTSTDFPVGCALGCAKSKVSCALTLLDQAKTIADMAQNLRNSSKEVWKGAKTDILNQVNSVGAFVRGVVQRVMETGKEAYKGLPFEGTVAVLITIVYTFAAEYDNLLDDLLDLHDMIWLTAGKLMEYMMSGWNGRPETTDIASIIANFGERTLKHAYKLSRPWTSNRCSPVDHKVVFTIEEAGDDQVIGPYIARGQRDGRPKYMMLGNPKVGVEYSGRQQKWRFFKLSPTGIFSRNLYLADASSENYPTAGWKAKDAPEPAPEVITVQDPEE